MPPIRATSQSSLSPPMEFDGTQVPPWIPLRAIGAAEKALAAAICFDY